MNNLMLSATDLLAGAETTFELTIPPHILQIPDATDKTAVVRIRPLSIGTFSLILRATKNDPSLLPLFMLKEALVEPTLTLEQVKKLPIGLVEFMLENVREVSGLGKKKSS